MQRHTSAIMANAMENTRKKAKNRVFASFVRHSCQFLFIFFHIDITFFGPVAQLDANASYSQFARSFASCNGRIIAKSDGLLIHVPGVQLKLSL